MANMNRKNVLLVMLVLILNWHQLESSKIAYKKPLYGKANALKDKRLKWKPTGKIGNELEVTTVALSTTETMDWPAPLEFVIITTPRSNPLATTTMQEMEIDSEESSSSNVLTSESTTPSDGSVTTAPASFTSSLDNTLPLPPTPAPAETGDSPSNQPVPCTCGVFLSSQIPNGLPETPLIMNELDRMYPCNAIGRKQCQTKCLEAIVQHLPNSASIVCSALGHDCHKERAYLFIKNCHNQWVNTNLQAGREYCCRNGLPYRCPLLG
ncbi:follicle cell protein 3C-1 [Drosophila willistoni]|nr:follicle cell protein 3C-1 [Drosophila willistoni]